MTAVAGVSMLLIVIFYPMVPNHIARSGGGLEDLASLARVGQPSTAQGIYSKEYQDQICSLDQ